MSTPEKIFQMFLALAGFVVFFAVLLFIVSRVRGRANQPVTVLAFVGPALVMLAFGLLYPAIVTMVQSFQNADSTAFVGLENYATLFTRAGVPAGAAQHLHLGPAGAHRRHR